MAKSQIDSLLARLHGRSPHFLLWRASQIAIGHLRRVPYRYELSLVPVSSIHKQFGGSKIGIADYLRQRNRVRLFHGIQDAKEVISFFTSQDAAYPQRVIAKAEKVLAHRIDILSHGETDLGPDIDWQKDYASGHRWKPAYVGDLDFLDRNNPSDVRIVWELNRLHFLVDLGKAFRVSGDDRYVREFMDITRCWWHDNPVAYTVNWANAMEVAIRAVNLIWALELCLPCPMLDDASVAECLQILIVSGRYIARNLEYNDLASNHYIANLLGLVYLGLYLPEYPEAQKWLRTGRNEIEAEMRLQVYEDGVDYEKSLPYHRLVTEMFLSAALLLQLNDKALSAGFMQRLERMVEFVQAYTCPDGTCPNVGDNDDGRLYWLGDQPANDHRYLLSTGAVVFNRSDFKQSSGRFWEESGWLTGKSGIAAFANLAVPQCSDEAGHSTAFPHGGFYIMRSQGEHLIVDCGDVARRGRGGHGHNDALSFTLSLAGERVLIDTGSSKYTADWAARRWVVGTAAHNTLVVDGQEIAELDLAGIGGPRDTPVNLVEWHSDQLVDRFAGEHLGYLRLESPVIHRRTIVFYKLERQFTFTDELRGEGTHTAELLFHFPPNMCVSQEAAGFCCCNQTSGRQFMVEFRNPGKLSLQSRPVYERYGRLDPACMGQAVYKVTLPVSINFRVYERTSDGALSNLT